MDKRIFHIKNTLKQRLGDAWSVEKMAAEVEMSVSYFQRVFREATGVTPWEYLNNLRLTKARELLTDPTCFLQIKQIRIRIGLNNDSHFTREFKDANGMTPTEYRQHHTEIHQSQSPDGQE